MHISSQRSAINPPLPAASPLDNTYLLLGAALAISVYVPNYNIKKQQGVDPWIPPYDYNSVESR